MFSAPDHIFRAYDIRGIVGKDLLPHTVLYCSAIFANIVEENGGNLVAASGDVRVSTPSLLYAATSGIMATGMDVVLAHPLPIPTFNYMVWSNDDIDGGAYITASHNPPEYNGVRFRRGDGTGFSAENIEIKRRFFEGKIRLAGWKSYGTCMLVDVKEIIDDYAGFVLDRAPPSERKLRIVIDCKHGAANLVAPVLMANHETLIVNGVIDGSFPTGMPDPLHGDVSLIMDVVRSAKADMGVAYDGDGDRAAFFDEEGRLVPAEVVGLFLAENLLRSGDCIIYNVMCSSIIRRRAEEMGLKTMECKVGDVFVAEAAKKYRAKLCVEESYHFFLPLYGFYYDDSMFVSLIMANILSQKRIRLSAIRKKYGEIHVIRDNIEVDDRVKFSVVEKFKEWATHNYEDVSTIDGVKIYFEDSSFLARPSNTEPLIRIMAEASSKEKALELLKHMKRRILDIISNIRPTEPEPP